MDGDVVRAAGAEQPMGPASPDARPEAPTEVQTEVVYETGHTRVLRRRTGPDASSSVIVKEYLGAGAGARLRRERAILARLHDVDGVTHLCGDRAQDQGLDVLAETDTGPIRLADRVVPGGCPVDDVIRLARDLVATVAAMHRCGVVHRDLNPANIMLDPETGRPVVIDFDQASAAVVEAGETSYTGDRRGTLPYLAPEQTGRTGGGVADHRTDLYGIGATLYEVASGRPPFVADDPLALVHAHLARIPDPLHVVNPGVPKMLSAIVARLLQKEPDARYQSAPGLAHDLSRLADDLAAGREPTWVLGERDFPVRLLPPARLVGLDEALSALEQAVSAAQEAPAVVVIRGPARVGKSALAERLRRRTAACGGRFVTGRANPRSQDPASTAVAQALRGIGQLLLVEQESDLGVIQARILAALGPNRDVATVLPEFALLLGADPAAPESLDGCARERLTQAWADLVRAVASPGRPLVMVLDDLHLAARTDLDVLDALVGQGGVPGLVPVMVFREDGTTEARVLTTLLEKWRRSGQEVTLVQVDGLAAAQLAEFLGAVLRQSPSQILTLAETLYEHTRGNPMHALDVVNALRQEAILEAGAEGWDWDAERVRQYLAAGDAERLPGQLVGRLPEVTCDRLATLACLGGTSTFADLATAAAVADDRLVADLAPAVRDALLIIEDAAEGDDSVVRFRHGGIHQAIEERVGSQGLGSVHLAAARRLHAAGVGDLLIADQYIAAQDLVVDGEEQRCAARVLHSAARRIRLADPERAGRLLDAAYDLLGRAATGEDDPVLAAVAADRHTSLYERGLLDEADSAYTWIAERTTDPLELAGPAQVQIAGLTNRSRTSEAVRLGLDLLHALGVAVPADLQSAIHAELDATASWVAQAGAAAASARELTDPRLLAAVGVMDRMLTPALLANPYTYPWLTLMARRLWGEHGPSSALIATTPGACGFLIALEEDFSTARALSRLAIEVGEGHGWEPATSIARCRYSVSVGHWFEPLQDVIGPTRSAQDVLLRAAEPHYAAMAHHALLPALLDCGPTIDNCDNEVRAAQSLAARTGSRFDEGVVLPYRQLLRCLRGQTREPGGFDDADFDEAAYLADPQLTPMAEAVFHVHRALSAALFGQEAELAHHARIAMQKLAFCPGYYVTALAYLLRALALAQGLRAQAVSPEPACTCSAGLRPAEQAGAQEALGELDYCRDWLAMRAAEAPANFAHLVQLIDGERAWAVGDHEAAARAFDAALGAVPPRERPWHHALIAERTGQFLLDRGLVTLGKEVLSHAAVSYQAWGAEGKVAELEHRYPQLRVKTRGERRAGTAFVTQRTGDASELIDLLGVIKASQAISQETNLDRLTERLTEVVGELSGATSVRILLRTADTREWTLLRAGSGHGTQLTDAVAGELVPLSAVRYAERTRAPLLVPDAAGDPRFAQDPYLTDVEHCSLMVIPVLSHGHPRALLLLENRLSRNVFTADQLGALTLVAGQLAVSLDNALAERFAALVRRAADTTLVCRDDGRLSYASPAAAELVDRPAEELPGLQVGELFHHEDRPAVLARIAPGAGEAADPTTLQCRVVREDGTHRWVEIAFTDLTADPAVAGVVLHLRDVTLRRKLESELRHAHKMESVGQLAAGLAHEINTPIQFVGDNLRFLSSALGDLTRVVQAYRTPDPSGPRAEEIAEEVDLDFLLEDLPSALAQTREGVDRVAAIVSAMKASVHPGTGTKAPTSLNEIVRNTLIIANNEIKYVADVVMELGELPPVCCDRNDINQVVLNLVVNAAQAIGERVGADGGRGTLTVRTRQDGDHALIEVQDTGHGIPPEAADRVFEPFFTTKPVGRGTGQGLSLAYILVHDRHGGRIDFRTVLGEGTTFTVRLPLGDDGASGEGVAGPAGEQASRGAGEADSAAVPSDRHGGSRPSAPEWG